MQQMPDALDPPQECKEQLDYLGLPPLFDDVALHGYQNWAGTHGFASLRAHGRWPLTLRALLTGVYVAHVAEERIVATPIMHLAARRAFQRRGAAA